MTDERVPDHHDGDGDDEADAIENAAAENGEAVDGGEEE